MAFAKCFLGTRTGIMACCAGAWNARDVPTSIKMVRIESLLSVPVIVIRNSPLAAMVMPPKQRAMICFLGNWSAATPDNRNNKKMGQIGPNQLIPSQKGL